MVKKVILFILPLFVLASCKDDDDIPQVQPEPIVEIPAFYNGVSRETPFFTTIADEADKIFEPQDLDFHPIRDNELWIINKGTYQLGGSTVTITNAGEDGQKEEWRRDGNAGHFMAFPSAISFSKTNENFGTTANILDANRSGGSFTGPTLWSSDLDVYAQDPGPGLNGSHLDMLHGSPYCMGIESDEDNAFWVFDSYNGHICWYDFANDHGPGHDDHSDGIIYRYVEMEVTRDDNGIPSHMVEDDPTGILFICDPAKGRILWMNTLSGQIDKSRPETNEYLASHQDMKNLEWGVFTDIDIKKPCGIEVIGDLLYISDNETNEIIAYNKETKVELARVQTPAKSIMGLKADSEGKLWYVDAEDDKVMRLDPK